MFTMGSIGKKRSILPNQHVTKICDICNSPFHPTAHNKKRCSPECSYEWFKNRQRKVEREKSLNKPKRKRICVICKEHFIIPHDSPSCAITCSDACSRKRHSSVTVRTIKKYPPARRQALRKYRNQKQKEYYFRLPKSSVFNKCTICDKEFQVIKIGRKKTCSSECQTLMRTRRIRNWQMKKKYGITLIEYENLLAQQNNQCMICSIHNDKCENGLYIDHDHDSKAVRGLICRDCNAGIGFLKDNYELLNKAAEYILKNKKSRGN